VARRGQAVAPAQVRSDPSFLRRFVRCRSIAWQLPHRAPAVHRLGRLCGRKSSNSPASCAGPAWPCSPAPMMAGALRRVWSQLSSIALQALHHKRVVAALEDLGLGTAEAVQRSAWGRPRWNTPVRSPAPRVALEPGARACHCRGSVSWNSSISKWRGAAHPGAPAASR